MIFFQGDGELEDIPYKLHFQNLLMFTSIFSLYFGESPKELD